MMPTADATILKVELTLATGHVPASSPPSTDVSATRMQVMPVVSLRSPGGAGAWPQVGRYMRAVVVSSALYAEAWAKTVLLAPLRLESELYGRSAYAFSSASQGRLLRPMLQIDDATAQATSLRPGRYYLCLDSLQAVAVQRIRAVGTLPATSTGATRQALDQLLPATTQTFPAKRALPGETHLGNVHHMSLADIPELGGKDRYALVLDSPALRAMYPGQHLVLPISTCDQQARRRELKLSLPRTLLDEPTCSHRARVYGQFCLDQLRIIDASRFADCSRGVVPRETVERALRMLRRLLV